MPIQPTRQKKEAFYMEQYIDLHTHSLFSDGSRRPEELIAYAKKKELFCLALTDHDTIDGLEEAIETGKREGIYVIPGIELSSDYHGKDIHILGYFIDYKSQDLQRKLELFQELRRKRNIKMVRLLNEGGYAISLENLYEIYGSKSVITRMHLAKALFDQGYVKDIPTAFATILAKDSPYYVPREGISPERAVSLIRENKGTAVLAHPTLYKLSDEKLRELISALKVLGLSGIETYYSTYTPEQTAYIKAIGEEFHLFPTGGSDYHGTSKPHIDLGISKGNLKIPATLLDFFPQWPEYKNSFH